MAKRTLGVDNARLREENHRLRKTAAEIAEELQERVDYWEMNGDPEHCKRYKLIVNDLLRMAGKV